MVFVPVLPVEESTFFIYIFPILSERSFFIFIFFSNFIMVPGADVKAFVPTLALSVVTTYLSHFLVILSREDCCCIL